ncbi:MAG: tetratricopeptide repeat protein [Treponema sp.]|nr:tetratricopeptide repeat protein [Treponema sp.]
MSFKKFLIASISTVLLTASPLIGAESNSAAGFYAEGCSAFSRGEWDSAVFLLRQTVANAAFNTADANYMLITAEIYAGDEKSALADCDEFLNTFTNSFYYSRIQYTKGKLLYNLKEYEKAIVTLSDFCHKNEKNELYPSALFYIAESLYADYKYEEAEAIYERIIKEFPENEKVSAAQYRIESIAQRSREEKLLYLLKQTGEEYLSAKEDYEKQLKLSNSDTITREKLVDYQQKNKELEEQIQDMENQIQQLKVLQAEKDAQIALKEAEEQQRLQEAEMEKLNQQKENQDEVRRLKEKAQILQQMMNRKKGE